VHPAYRVGSPNHRWQRLIADLKLLSRILRLIDGLGHDESDRLADKPSLIGRHRVVAGRNRPGASNPRGHIRRPHEPCAMRYRREPIGDIVGAREHGEHTHRRERCRLVDGDNSCVGMW